MNESNTSTTSLSGTATSKWRLVLGGVLTTLISIPLSLFGVMMATFASDSGPNFVSYATLLVAASVVPVAIVLSVVAFKKNSAKFLGLAFAYALFPIPLLMALSLLLAVST